MLSGCSCCKTKSYREEETRLPKAALPFVLTVIERDPSRKPGEVQTHPKFSSPQTRLQEEPQRDIQAGSSAVTRSAAAGLYLSAGVGDALRFDPHGKMLSAGSGL